MKEQWAQTKRVIKKIFFLKIGFRRLAKTGILLDSGKQKDYVHFGIIMRPTHINCIFCVQTHTKRLWVQKKLAENMVKGRARSRKTAVRLKD